MTQRLEGLHDRKIIGSMHDRVRRVADIVDLIRRHALAIELGEVAHHSATQPKTGKGDARSSVDLAKGGTFRPLAPRRCRLSIDRRTDKKRIELELGLVDHRCKLRHLFVERP